jgi:hypothetical protein
VSRSNPHENGTPNPAKRWFEWTGEKGIVRYYDKAKETNVDVGSDFTFLLLDELACVRGWHDASDSGIYSNEVKDTRQDVLVVKSFKGGPIAEGLYKDIKDRVNNAGGAFNANCYIAFKDEAGELQIGSLRFKGAALGAWMEFRKEHRADLYKKAVRIDGYTEGQKGRVVFRVPQFKVVSISEATDNTAKGLDAELQEFLAGYLKKNKLAQAEAVAQHVSDEDIAADVDRRPMEPITDDSIPF